MKDLIDNARHAGYVDGLCEGLGAVEHREHVGELADGWDALLVARVGLAGAASIATGHQLAELTSGQLQVALKAYNDAAAQGYRDAGPDPDPD